MWDNTKPFKAILYMLSECYINARTIPFIRYARSEEMFKGRPRLRYAAQRTGSARFYEHQFDLLIKHCITDFIMRTSTENCVEPDYDKRMKEEAFRSKQFHGVLSEVCLGNNFQTLRSAKRCSCHIGSEPVRPRKVTYLAYEERPALDLTIPPPRP